MASWTPSRKPWIILQSLTPMCNSNTVQNSNIMVFRWFLKMLLSRFRHTTIIFAWWSPQFRKKEIDPVQLPTKSNKIIQTGWRLESAIRESFNLIPTSLTIPAWAMAATLSAQTEVKKSLITGSWSSIDSSKNNVVTAFSFAKNDIIIVSYEPTESRVVFSKKGTEQTHTI